MSEELKDSGVACQMVLSWILYTGCRHSISSAKRVKKPRRRNMHRSLPASKLWRLASVRKKNREEK